MDDSHTNLLVKVETPTAIANEAVRLQRTQSLLERVCEPVIARQKRRELEAVRTAIATEVAKQGLQREGEVAVLVLHYRAEELTQVYQDAHNQRMDELTRRAVASAADSVVRHVEQRNEVLARLRSLDTDAELKQSLTQDFDALMCGNIQRTMTQNGTTPARDIKRFGELFDDK
jgi:hypothetical protein